MSNLPSPNCDRINLYKSTNGTGVIKGFQGIPQNLTINIVAFVIIFLGFCFIRKKAWNYGRIALYGNKENKSDKTTNYNVWSFISYGSTDKLTESTDLSGDKEQQIRQRAYSVDDKTSVFDQGYFNWIRFFWLISDKDIQEKAGPDAYQYLLFEKYLIAVTIIMSIVSIGIMLPLHIYGSEKNVTRIEFVSTTILNLPSTSPLIWIHAITSFVLFLLIICVIWHYASKVKIITIKETSNTLMIEGIPKKYCFKSFIMDHFKRAYPEIGIQDIHFAHNVKKLIDLNLQRESAIHAKEAAIEQYQLTGVPPTMVARFGGRLLCCCAERVDVIEYYDTELLNLDTAVETERLQAYENKIGIAFLILNDIEDATKIVEDYQSECFMPNYPRESSLSAEIHSNEWIVSYAPPPNVINWENLSSSSRKWYLKAAIINGIVFIILFILTTPTYVMNVLQLNSTHFKGVFMQRFLQSFIMWLVSVILPFMVYYSEILIGHWTKLQEHCNVFIKTYVYLIIMVLILPSLGIASLPAFIQWLIPMPSATTLQSGQTTTPNPNDLGKFLDQWLCIYAPGNSAFFVNYIITAAFIGTIAELARIPELLIYLYYQIVVKSSAEMWGIRKRVLWEFQFGLSYAWILCVFAVTVTYSVICPFVVPFGCLYIVLRYLFDRYNLYFAYERSFIDARIHRIALAFTVFAFLLLQVNLLVYLKVKGTAGNLIFVFVFIGFLLSFILFILLTINGWFTQTKTQYLVSKPNQSSPATPTTQFMPLLTTINLTKKDKSSFSTLPLQDD